MDSHGGRRKRAREVERYLTGLRRDFPVLVAEPRNVRGSVAGQP